MTDNKSEATVHQHPTNDKAALQDRLAAAKVRRREAEAKRAAQQTAGELQEQVDLEERAAHDEEAIAEAEEKHGAKKIRVINTELGCVIVKRPNPLVYKRFRDRESHKSQDLDKLVRACLVYPNTTTFDAIIDEIPGTLDVAADRVIHLAGFRAEEVSKK